MLGEVWRISLRGWEWHRGCYGNPRSEYQNPSLLQSPQQEGRHVRVAAQSILLPVSSRPPCPGVVWRQWPERKREGSFWDAVVSIWPRRPGMAGDSTTTAAKCNQSLPSASSGLSKTLNFDWNPWGQNNRVSKVVEIVFLAHPAI